MKQEPVDGRPEGTIASSSTHPSAASSTHPSTASSTLGQKDHFLRLMFFQASHESAPPGAPPLEPITGPYVPLRHLKTQRGDSCVLPSAVLPVRLDSPAFEVMTDLRKIGAVTIGEAASVDEANRTMMSRRVRALFVVDDGRNILGIVTATDVLGERPIQFAQSRGIRHNEVSVRDIMTPADRLELLDIRDVVRARVGDIVATLRLVDRQHALAVHIAEASQKIVCGIFSLTQIARQLGIPPQQTHDIARTFAEIEAAIAT